MRNWRIALLLALLVAAGCSFRPAPSTTLGLVVADPEPDRPSYNRDDYMPNGWADFDGNCLRTRHEVLVAQSTVTVEMATPCRVASGRWIDQHTGLVITDANDTTIDHVVALAEAHRSGGWAWDAATKQRFANDPAHLWVTAQPVNQAKADKAPDRWLPPDEAAHCRFATTWVQTKQRWQLTATEDEVAALAEILIHCDQPAGEVAAPQAAPITTTVLAPGVASSTLRTVPIGVGDNLVLVSCDAREEVVEVANVSATPIAPTSYLLHDQGSKHAVVLGDLEIAAIAPGASVRILTGENPRPESNDAVWKAENVWNNDGDVAHLVDPEGKLIGTIVCRS